MSKHDEWPIFLVVQKPSDGGDWEHVGATVEPGIHVSFNFGTREEANEFRVVWARKENRAPDDYDVLEYRLHKEQ